MDPTGKKRFKPPAGMIAKAVKNQWSEATLETWVRQNDPAYKNTAAYKTLASNFKTMLAGIFGARFNIASNKKLHNAMVEYAKLPPDKAVNDTVVMKYFKKYVMNTLSSLSCILHLKLGLTPSYLLPPALLTSLILLPSWVITTGQSILIPQHLGRYRLVLAVPPQRFHRPF